MSCGFEEADAGPVAGCVVADEAFRAMSLVRNGVVGEARDCCSWHGRVHVENEDVAAEKGAMMAGG